MNAPAINLRLRVNCIHKEENILHTATGNSRIVIRELFHTLKESFIPLTDYPLKPLLFSKNFLNNGFRKEMLADLNMSVSLLSLLGYKVDSKYI